MTLPAFAQVEDLEARLGRTLDGLEPARAQAALDDASALIRVEAGKDWATGDDLDDDRPAILETICLAVARRVMENPEALEEHTETVGDATEGKRFTNASNDVYLTSAEKAMVRKAAGNRSGLWTLPTTRGYLETMPVAPINSAPELVHPEASAYQAVDGGEPVVYYGDEP